MRYVPNAERSNTAHWQCPYRDCMATLEAIRGIPGVLLGCWPGHTPKPRP
jgi:hypothetical protein